MPAGIQRLTSSERFKAVLLGIGILILAGILSVFFSR
jgi:hypothetical protein